MMTLAGAAAAMVLLHSVSVTLDQLTPLSAAAPALIGYLIHSGLQDMWTLGLLGALGCFNTDLD